MRDEFGAFTRHNAVEGDDAAEGGLAVGLKGLGVGFSRVGANSDTAGVGVLDNDAARLLEGAGAFPSRIAVSDVVVREFLTLKLFVARQQTGATFTSR